MKTKLHRDENTRSRDVVREYVRRLSEPDFGYLYPLLNERYPGEPAEVLEFLGRHSEMDRVIRESGATSGADGVYDIIDWVYDEMNEEIRRFNS